MKDLKFRAWYIKSKEMTAKPFTLIEAIKRQATELEDAALMQFTGFEDINGKEIYEGDIVKYFMDGDWKYGMIFWSQGGFSVKVFRFGKEKRDYTFYFQSFIPVPNTGNTMQDQFQVIGNIWENTDLIK